MKKYQILKCIQIALWATLAALGIGFIVMMLWNCLIPELFGGPAISFFQALGILLLAKILFGGFKKGGGHCPQCGSRWQKHGRWRESMKEKLANMSPEQKEKFKTNFKNRCGGFGFKEDPKNDED